jgi:hypothetical protein
MRRNDRATSEKLEQASVVKTKFRSEKLVCKKAACITCDAELNERTDFFRFTKKERRRRVTVKRE